MGEHSVMYPPIYRGHKPPKWLVAIVHKKEYEKLKGAIYEYLRRRKGFEKAVDSALIEQAARLFADWLYIEELMTSEHERAKIWKYADALTKVHSMLTSVLEELKLTPKAREKLIEEIQADDEVTKRLKELVGAK